MEKTYDRGFLLACATEVLGWIALQDPTYASRIAITKSERNYDDLQTLGLYCARVLDAGDHMYFAEHPFLAPEYAGHLGPRACVVCDQVFTPGRAEDQMCGKPDCSAAYYAALDSAHEKKNAS